MANITGPAGFGECMNIFMNIAMGIIITLAINICVCMQVGMNIMTPEAVIASWFSSFVIGYTAGELGDPMGWAMKLAAKVKAGGFVTWVIQAVVLGTYFGMIILAGNMLVNNLAAGGVAAWLGGFATWAVFVEICAVIAVFVIIKPCMALSASVSGFNPAQAEASQH